MKFYMFLISALFIASAFAEKSFSDELKPRGYANLKAEEAKQAAMPDEQDENELNDDIPMGMPQFDTEENLEDEWGSSGFCHTAHHEACSQHALKHCKGQCDKYCSRFKYIRPVCKHFCSRRCTCRKALDVYYHCQGYVCSKEKIECYKGCIKNHSKSCQSCGRKDKGGCKDCRECWERCVKPKTEIVCEHGRKVIACTGNKKLGILKANYGRTSKKECRRRSLRQNTSCRSKNSLKVVRHKCNGKHSCTLFASNRVFGDPCRGTFKYLKVVYVCY